MEKQQQQPTAGAKGGPVSDRRLVARFRREVDICELVRLRNRMKQHLHDWNTALHADQVSCFRHVHVGVRGKGVKKDLERCMEELRIIFQNRTTALQRMQLGFQLQNRVKQCGCEPRQISGHVNSMTILCWAAAHYQQEVRDKELKLIDIKMKRLSLKKSGERKMLQIHTNIKKIVEKKRNEREQLLKASKKLATMHHNIQKERERITLLQNVFQSILIGSGVNWARDTSLKAIALQLEKNACYM